MDIAESFFRWAHVVAGILWIGLLYFFNWVNSQFAPLLKELDADAKKKVLPELLPRALYWFRWGAAWTWVTGFVLLGIVFWHSKEVLATDAKTWHPGAVIMIVFTFLAVFLYDLLYKTVLKSPAAGFWGGLALTAVAVYLYVYVGNFSFRGYTIHLGALFGTNMAFNVWYRIWPAQKRIIRAIKNGEAPDPALAALAGTRSKHNTYMSVPLVFAMLNAHMTWAAGLPGTTKATAPLILVFIVFVGWSITWMLYKRSAKIKQGHPSFLPEA